MSEFVFKAVTSQSGKLKVFFEIIFQNLATATLTISAKGILLQDTTTQSLTFRVFLPAEKFEQYHFEGSKEAYAVGLSNNINKEFLKSVKNKDKIIMATAGPYDFVFKKESKDVVQSLSVTIQDVVIIQYQQIEYCTPFIKLPSEEYGQMCRVFPPTHNLSVTKQYGQIIFGSKTQRSEKQLICGTKNINDIDMIHREYVCEQFSRLSKIQSLAEKNGHIEVYYENDKPLKFVVKNSIMDFEVMIYEQSENN